MHSNDISSASSQVIQQSADDIQVGQDYADNLNTEGVTKKLSTKRKAKKRRETSSKEEKSVEHVTYTGYTLDYYTFMEENSRMQIDKTPMFEAKHGRKPFNLRPEYQKLMDSYEVELYHVNLHNFAKTLKRKSQFADWLAKASKETTTLDKKMQKYRTKSKHELTEKQIRNNLELIDQIQNGEKSSSGKVPQTKLIEVVLQPKKLNFEVLEVASDLSSDSERLTDRAWEFNQSKSRQVLVRDVTSKIVSQVLSFVKTNEREEYLVSCILLAPIAAHYFDKVLNRVSLKLEGHSIGSMIDSEFEDLQIDSEFERQRYQLENESSMSEKSEEPRVELIRVEEYEAERNKSLQAKEVKQVDQKKKPKVIQKLISISEIQTQVVSTSLLGVQKSQVKEALQVLELEIFAIESPFCKMKTQSQVVKDNYYKEDQPSSLNSESIRTKEHLQSQVINRDDVVEIIISDEHTIEGPYNIDLSHLEVIKPRLLTEVPTPESSKVSQDFNIQAAQEEVNSQSEKMLDFNLIESAQMGLNQDLVQPIQHTSVPRQRSLIIDEELYNNNGQRKPLIDINESFEIIQQYKNASSKHLSQRSFKLSDRVEQSPDRLNDYQQPSAPKFENSPTDYFQRYPSNMKWREVLKFMKENPNVMLNFMPPTPNKTNLRQNRIVNNRAGVRQISKNSKSPVSETKPMMMFSNSNINIIRPATSKMQTSSQNNLDQLNDGQITKEPIQTRPNSTFHGRRPFSQANHELLLQKSNERLLTRPQSVATSNNNNFNIKKLRSQFKNSNPNFSQTELAYDNSNLLTFYDKRAKRKNNMKSQEMEKVLIQGKIVKDIKQLREIRNQSIQKSQQELTNLIHRNRKSQENSPGAFKKENRYERLLNLKQFQNWPYQDPKQLVREVLAPTQERLENDPLKSYQLLQEHQKHNSNKFTNQVLSEMNDYQTKMRERNSSQINASFSRLNPSKHGAQHRLAKQAKEQTKTTLHEKRLEKLQKLRKKIKNKSSQSPKAYLQVTKGEVPKIIVQLQSKPQSQQSKNDEIKFQLAPNKAQMLESFMSPKHLPSIKSANESQNEKSPQNLNGLNKAKSPQAMATLNQINLNFKSKRFKSAHHAAKQLKEGSNAISLKTKKRVRSSQKRETQSSKRNLTSQLKSKERENNSDKNVLLPKHRVIKSGSSRHKLKIENVAAEFEVFNIVDATSPQEKDTVTTSLVNCNENMFAQEKARSGNLSTELVFGCQNALKRKVCDQKIYHEGGKQAVKVNEKLPKIKRAKQSQESIDRAQTSIQLSIKTSKGSNLSFQETSGLKNRSLQNQQSLVRPKHRFGLDPVSKRQNELITKAVEKALENAVLIQVKSNLKHQKQAVFQFTNKQSLGEVNVEDLPQTSRELGIQTVKQILEPPQAQESLKRTIIDEIKIEDLMKVPKVMQTKPVTPRQSFVVVEAPPSAEMQKSEKPALMQQGIHDWSETSLYQHCKTLKRFKKPILDTEEEKQIISIITQMRLNPQAYQRAHILLPIYECTAEYLDKLLSHEMKMDRLLIRIKKQYLQVDYSSTLKFLVRAKICCQIKHDVALLICRYLDILELKSNIQQLRDENASDCLIHTWLSKMYHVGKLFIQTAHTFDTDYQKTFKSQKLIFNGQSAAEYVNQILIEFGVLIQEYEELDQSLIDY